MKTNLILLLVTIHLLSLLYHSTQSCAFPVSSTDVEVMAGTTVSNQGPTQVLGSVAAASTITGFPYGFTLPNAASLHANDVVYTQVSEESAALYTTALGTTCTVTYDSFTDLGGLTLTSGVYCFTGSAQITGNLTLDGQNSATASWLFKVGSTLTVVAGSEVIRINGAQSCSVLWQVLGSCSGLTPCTTVTLGLNSLFTGTILASYAINVLTEAQVVGRLLSLHDRIQLDNNALTLPVAAGYYNYTTTCK